MVALQEEKEKKFSRSITKGALKQCKESGVLDLLVRLAKTHMRKEFPVDVGRSKTSLK
jgi:hypothetical protein